MFYSWPPAYAHPYLAASLLSLVGGSPLLAGVGCIYQDPSGPTGQATADVNIGHAGSATRRPIVHDRLCWIRLGSMRGYVPAFPALRALFGMALVLVCPLLLVLLMASTLYPPCLANRR